MEPVTKLATETQTAFALRLVQHEAFVEGFMRGRASEGMYVDANDASPYADDAQDEVRH